MILGIVTITALLHLIVCRNYGLSQRYTKKYEYGTQNTALPRYDNRYHYSSYEPQSPKSARNFYDFDLQNRYDEPKKRLQKFQPDSRLKGTQKSIIKTFSDDIQDFKKVKGVLRFNKDDFKVTFDQKIELKPFGLGTQKSAFKPQQKKEVKQQGGHIQKRRISQSGKISKEDRKKLKFADDNVVKGSMNLVKGKGNYISMNSHRNVIQGEGNIVF